jgi:transcriptional regulator with XRE-family HTH domain
MYLGLREQKEVRMLRKEDFAVIKSLKQRGVYQKDIASELGVHPRTVSRALKRDGVPRRERKRSGSKLAPYQPKIDQLLSEGVWNAKVILREIQALGYTGGYTILRAYIQPKRALRPGRAIGRVRWFNDRAEIDFEYGVERKEVDGQVAYVYQEK